MKKRTEQYEATQKNSFFWVNREKIFVVFFIYLTAILSIGIVNFPYLDDVKRQLDGSTDFARHYSRWGSEIASWIFQGSTHLTDMGLTTHILTVIIMSAASLIVVYVLSDGEMGWVSLIASTFIGLNPWFLQSVSFRFDSPFMALSVLASVVPFLWWKDKRLFFIFSIVGIFLMCNTYQASSGIYIVMTLALCFKALLANEDSSEIIKKIVLAAGAYIAGMVIYVIEVKLNPEVAARTAITGTAGFFDIPATIIRNIGVYFSSLFSNSAGIWLFLFLLIVLLFVVSSLVNSQVNPVSALLYCTLYLLVGAILSYGVYLIFNAKLAENTPRAAYGFSFFISTLLILMTVKADRHYLQLPSKILTAVFMYYMLSFPFIYASMLSYQKEAFERQSVHLMSELGGIVNEGRKTIFINRLFDDSPILENAEENYPILEDLVPRNGTVYWPNITLFNTYTNLGVSMEYLDLASFDPTDKQLEMSNKYYDIYTLNDQIFVHTK